MSEKQIQAYLVARDVLRRIRRTSSLVLPRSAAYPDPGDRSESTRLGDRSNGQALA